MKSPNTALSILFFIAAIIICFIAGSDFLEMHRPDKIHPGNSLSKIGKLSDYHSKLEGSNGNSDIYYFNAEEAGGTVLLLGGTHPNESAGFIAAVLLLENIRVDRGRVIIIPQACLSGFSCTDPMEGCPQFFSLNTKSGNRTFRFGSRVSNPVDQWPDPLVYSHYPSGQKLSGFETRNLNRAYPGRENGTFTEQVAFAIVELIKKEKVNIAIDLHEAAPEIPIINAIVYHEKGEELGLTAVLNLEFEDLKYSPELSPKNFHGLSHREWGDYTDAYAFLMETSNPVQGRLRGKTNAGLIVEGLSQRYKEALESGVLRITYDTSGEEISKRVGRHVQGFLEILNAYNDFNEENKILVNNIPTHKELIKSGVGNYLN